MENILRVLRVVASLLSLNWACGRSVVDTLEIQ